VPWYNFPMARETIAAANAALNARTALLNSGILRIYSGTRPATADTALGAQVLLAECTLNATAFGAAANRVATANAVTQDTSANAAGNPSFSLAMGPLRWSMFPWGKPAELRSCWSTRPMEIMTHTSLPGLSYPSHR
jgi:hypothetical protein